jgi:metal transporter CNNM
MWKYCLLVTLVSAHPSELIDLPLEDYIFYSSLSIGVVLFAGCMSGLTVGLMSIDELELKMKLAQGTDEEKRQAFRVLRIIKDHHLLLVTLLIANACAMETLPLLLDCMFAQVLVVIISVTFVFLFGEVIPQAICIGPNQLKVAAKMVPMVKVVTAIFFPISWPIAKCLDYFLGKEHHAQRLKLEKLKALIEFHAMPSERNVNFVKEIYADQTKIIHGALSFVKERVKDHMIELSRICSVSCEAILDNSLIKSLHASGFNRIPVYLPEGNDKIKGIICVKDLANIERNVPISRTSILTERLIYIHPENNLFDAMELLKSSKSAMAFVVEDLKYCNSPRDQEFTEDSIAETLPKVIGLITLSDILALLMKETLKKASSDNIQMIITLHNPENPGDIVPTFREEKPTNKFVQMPNVDLPSNSSPFI